ncbi:YajQ family cyclic di-GMP-binding protein [Candidatus Saccharibacteria bacterium]|jgi:uncharacterized protein YajQ (UPF0234 family)|nr:YajQ family cyclic di-GMP-binding protein [Candidatus Saccharibacteria bacterium]MBP9131812.1 YajQ family cyclic di-GMP-binding protein [Candidatus Saccharibacteria bacterium]
MAKTFSFDVVSDYDIAEVANAVDQAKRELVQRYDFKGTPASIELIEDKTIVQIKGNDYQLDVILEMLRGKLGKRGVSQNTLDTSASKEQGNPWRWKLALQKGLDQEKAKKITKLIRDNYPKVKTQIQGQEVRITSGDKDELQSVMKLLNSQDYPFPLNFTNFR